MIYPSGATQLSVRILWLDDSGFAVTGKVAADWPIVKWGQNANVADTAITISDLALITTAHPNDNVAGGVYEYGNGEYRLDLPNTVGAAADGMRYLQFAETTDKRLQMIGELQIGQPAMNVAQWSGTNVAAPDTAGYPKVTLKTGTGAGEAQLSSGKIDATLDAGDVTGYLPVNAVEIGGVPQTGFDIGSAVFSIEGTVNNSDYGCAAIKTAVDNINNLSALANLYGPQILEIPDSSTVQFPFTLTIRDEQGHLVDLDSSPTIAATNAAGTDRSANLSAVTHVSTGVYTFTYGVASNAAEEGLRISATGAVSTSPRRADFGCSVANYDSITTLAAIKAKTDNLPADPAGQTNITAAALGATERNAIASAVWAALTSALTAAGSIGNLLVTDVDAKISSISGGGGFDPTSDEPETGYTYQKAVAILIAVAMGNVTVDLDGTVHFLDRNGDDIATTKPVGGAGARVESTII